MTTKRDMLEYIEDGLGTEGSAALAEQIFEELKRRDCIAFSGTRGFEFAGELVDNSDDPDTAERVWMHALNTVAELSRVS